MPLLKRTNSNAPVKSASPDHADEAHQLTFEEARDLVHFHLASAGLSSARGLHDDGTGGAHIGSTQLYYDFNPTHHCLTCSALVYHFRHHPSPDVVQAFRDSVTEIDTGGGQLLYEDDNSGLYLTRSYWEDTSRSQFKKDMEHLLRAARDWSDMGAERAFARLQGAPLVPHMAPATELPRAAPPKAAIASPTVTSQSAARRAHQRSDSTTPPMPAGHEGDRVNQQDVGSIHTFASTPVSARPTTHAPTVVAAAATTAPAAAASTGTSSGLVHPRPVPARAVHTSTPRPPTNGVPRIGVVATAEDGDFAADSHAAAPTITMSSAAATEVPLKTPPHDVHESLFQKLLHKFPHRPHSPKTEEERHHPTHPHPLAKLDPNEPRPSGMPLRIYSSPSPSRAMWEHPVTEPKAQQHAS